MNKISSNSDDIVAIVERLYTNVCLQFPMNKVPEDIAACATAMLHEGAQLEQRMIALVTMTETRLNPTPPKPTEADDIAKRSAHRAQS